ncbi:unnamed protein product [Coffea canephora]|uniref:Uncharacterized protein n=1 Tax=Coffea canephora TaxID=49390 RepID=A0A068TSU3_COFCA|nr:unnamed protein product [Coffea canephora]
MKTTNTCGLHLQPCHSPSPPLLILHHHYHRQQPPGSWQPPLQLTSTATTTIPYNHNLLLQPVLQICRCRRWDSNAESFRTRNFNHNFDEEEDDDDTGNDDIVEQGLGVLEDYIDSIWIIKVFRSFGWALPFILVSILLATGLKAFLMALALPLGQSTFSFAIQKMRGGKDKRPKHKTKTKSRSYPRSSRTVERGKEKRATNPGKKKAKMGYQSWVPGHDDSTDQVEKNAPTFGGWDELDGLSEFDIGSSSSSGQSVGKSKNSPLENGRLSMRTEKSDTPLLLRLLIAVFPFLAKML